VEERFEKFLDKSDSAKIDTLVNELELEEDRELESIIIDLSSFTF
jgi:hypothetical protein